MSKTHTASQRQQVIKENGKLLDAIGLTMRMRNIPAAEALLKIVNLYRQFDQSDRGKHFSIKSSHPDERMKFISVLMEEIMTAMSRDGILDVSVDEIMRRHMKDNNLSTLVFQAMKEEIF